MDQIINDLLFIFVFILINCLLEIVLLILNYLIQKNILIGCGKLLPPALASHCQLFVGKYFSLLLFQVVVIFSFILFKRNFREACHF